MAVSQNADWLSATEADAPHNALAEDCTGRKRNAVLVYADLKQFKCVLTESGRRDSNPRHPRWQRGALPLSYSRDEVCDRRERQKAGMLRLSQIAVKFGRSLSGK